MDITITRTPQAQRDLLELADSIAQDSLDAAERFFDAAEEAFHLLAGMPEMGTLCQFQNSEAAGVRVWSIRRFENYLVFYRPIEAGIDVVRVIHGARDIPVIFADNPNA
jgi:toxin ParE1/3/4